MVFYLKVNRVESYTYKNLQHWMDAFEFLHTPDIYILCDNEDLKKNIINRVKFGDLSIRFLKSCVDSKELKHIISNIADEKWENAGYAHLTTFWHAKEKHIEKFWNIDADDTFLCLSPERICKMLEKVEKYADENEVNAFSLDMWRTREPDHWTFGVTYIDNRTDWIKIMGKHCMDPEMEEHIHREKNIDAYFTYLKARTSLKIETYYFENLKFIHYSNDFFRRTIVSGIFHWRKGMLCFPLLYYCLDMKTVGLLPIAEDIVKLDIDISDQETSSFMIMNSMDKHLIDEYENALTGEVTSSVTLKQ